MFFIIPSASDIIYCLAYDFYFFVYKKGKRANHINIDRNINAHRYKFNKTRGGMLMKENKKKNEKNEKRNVNIETGQEISPESGGCKASRNPENQRNQQRNK